MNNLEGQVKPVSVYYSLQPLDNNSYIVTDANVYTEVRVPPLYYNKDYPIGYTVTVIAQGEPATILLPDDLTLTVPNGVDLTKPGQQCIIVKTDSMRWLIDVIKSDGGGGDYVLPKATANTLGGIKVGKNLTMNADGSLDAPAPIPGPAGKDGIDGKDGLQGPKGDKGDQGIQGIQGLKGDTGQAGKDGVDGKDGQQGPKGDTGSQGPKGDKGDPGEGGAVEVQLNGLTITKTAKVINFIGDVLIDLVGDVVNIDVGAIAAPGQITDLIYSKFNPNLVFFKFTEPTDGIKPFKYFVNISINGGTHSETEIECISTDTGMQAQLVLTPDTNYEVYFYAVNQYGKGQPSNIVKFKTDAATKPTAPKNLKLASITTTNKATFNFDKATVPLPEQIDYYEIKDYRGITKLDFIDKGLVSAFTTYNQATDKTNTKFNVSVRAITGYDMESDFTPEITILTVPGMPIQTKLIGGEGKFDLGFKSCLTDGAEAYTDYKFTLTNSNGKSVGWTKFSPTFNSVTKEYTATINITDPDFYEDNVKIYYSLFNASGQGDAVAKTVSIKKPTSKPVAPTPMWTATSQENLASFQLNGGTIPAGDSLDFYNYRLNGGSAVKAVLTDSIHFKVQLDKHNTAYQLAVQTVAKSGAISDWSSTTAAITPPDGPQLLTAVSNAPQSVDITFKANANDGVEPYTKYYYSVYNSQVGTGMVEFTTKSFSAGVYSATITNIDPKACTADAKFQIAIANKVGQGTTSNSMTIEIKAPVMPTPENLKILNIDNKRNCLLDFKTITTDLDEVDYYNVKYNSITQKYISKIKDATTSEINLGLPTYSEQYSIQIQAVSKLGFLSNWSEIVKGIVPPGPPVVVTANGGLASVKINIKPNELDKTDNYENWIARLEGSFGTVYKNVSRVSYQPDQSLDCEFTNLEDKYCVNGVTPYICITNTAGESLYSVCPVVNITKDNDKPKIVSFSTPNKKMVQLTVTGVKADQAIVVSFDRLKTDGTSYNEQFSRTLPPDSPYNYYYGDFVYSGDYNISFQPDNIPKWSDPVKITIR